MFAAILAVAFASQADSVAQDKDKDTKARAAAVENLKKIKIDKPTIVETEHFLVVGSIPEDKAKALGAVLEKTLPVARKAAKYDEKDVAWKGKLTVYYLPDSDEFKSFMRRVLQASPEGVHVDVKAEPAFIVDPADSLPGKPSDADLFAATAARVAGELLQAKGTGTQVVPAWLRDGFGRAAQMRAEGLNSRRYTAYKAAAKTAALNPKGGKSSIADAWSDAKSAAGEALGTSVAEFLAFGPKAADFGKFIDALKPSEENPNPTVQNGFTALGWKDEAAADAAWKRWVQTGK